MDVSGSQLIAALVAQHPGSSVQPLVDGATLVSVLYQPHPSQLLPQEVLVLEADASLELLASRLAQSLHQTDAKLPLSLIVVNPERFDVKKVVKAAAFPSFFQRRVVSAWLWVPGEKPTHLGGPKWPHVETALATANAGDALSLEEAHGVSAREGAVVQNFLMALQARKPVVNWTIAALCVAIFGLQMYWGAGEPVLAASRMGAEIPARVLEGEWWRLLSVMLLHGNIAHLVLNMLALLSFGPFLERLIGSGRYLALYVLSGVGGSLLSLTRGGEGIGVGASGGVWGLMVAGAVVVTWPRNLIPHSMAKNLRQRAWTPVAINLLYSLQPGIDMLAHLGGGLAGGVLVLLLTSKAEGTPLRRSVSLGFLGAAVGALLLASMGIAIAQGKPWELIGPWTLQTVELEGTEGLKLKIPSNFELKHQPDSRQWHWGDLNATGAEIFVVIEPFETQTDESEALSLLMNDLQKPLEGFHYARAPAQKTLPGGRRVIFAEMTPDDRRDARFLWQWWSIDEETQSVMILANALNSTSSQRRQQLEYIADSLTAH